MYLKSTGASLLSKLKIAVPELSDHQSILQQLESIIEAHFIGQWTAEVEAWEADPTAPNPFEPRTKGISEPSAQRVHTYGLVDPTQSDVRLQLAQQDATELRAENSGIGGDVSGRMMVMMGIELEALQ